MAEEGWQGGSGIFTLDFGREVRESLAEPGNLERGKKHRLHGVDG